MKVESIVFNWRYTPHEEQFSKATVGQYFTNKIVEEIIEHSAKGEGDRWFYDIVFEGRNTVMRVFNPNVVIYKNELNQDQ